MYFKCASASQDNLLFLLSAKASIDNMASSRHCYRHAPLKSSRSIRVLVLSAAGMSSDDPIQCELIEVSLDNLRSGTGVRFQTKDTLRANAIKYDALSYAWGSPEPARWIECEGLPIRVTDNCYTAMKRLQSSHTQPSLRFLWIDSICIDQRSPQERSQQVAMMGEVYRKAQRVIVWLGQEDEYSREAIKHLRGIQKYVKRHPDPFFKTEAMLKQTPRDYNKGQPLARVAFI